MTQVFVNGKIYTQNDAKDLVDTVVIDDGVFTYVGARDGYSPTPDDEVIDLEGKCVLPGLIDSHQHWLYPIVTSGPHANEMPFIFSPSLEDVLDQCKQFVEAHPDYQVYKVQAGNKDLWSRKPNKRDFDEFCPDKPFMMLDASTHAWSGNSKLFEAIGVTKDTPDPSPGLSQYARDENGEPTGYATEYSAFDALRVVDTVPREDAVDNLRKLIEFNISMGITGVYDAGTLELKPDEETMDILKELDEAGELKQRVSISSVAHLPSRLPGLVEREVSHKKNYEGGNIITDTVKIFIDGTPGERTAFLLKPYKGTDILGASMMTPDELYKAFVEANEAGFNVHLHICGDASLRMVLDAIERMDREGIDRKVKFILAHCQLVDPQDMPRLGELGVYVNLTPHWAGSLAAEPDPSFFMMHGYENEQYQSIWNNAANVAWSCDAAALPWIAGSLSSDGWNPFHGWQIGATRLKVGDTDQSHVHMPEERMTIDQMIQGYTINGARQLGIDDICGSIEVGKSADMAVLDANPYEIPIEEVHAILPEKVYFKGALAYER